MPFPPLPFPGLRNPGISFLSFTFHMVKSNYLRPSFHMDCLLPLWPLLLLASLVNL